LELSVPVRILLRTCQYWFAFWFFYLGASIGSFINVVAHRTPQGQTIVTRGSHCPYCDHPLSMIDNSPVFGWVLLRGRCRTCHLPISPRYLAMELLVAGIFMILGVVELIGNGMNLPHRDWRFGYGIVNTVFAPKWELIGAYVGHCSLFAVALMLIGSQREGLRFPRIPLAGLLGVAMLAATFNEWIGPVRWTEPFGPGFPSYGTSIREHALTSAIGAAAGGALGVVGVLLFGWAVAAPATRPSAWRRHGVFLSTVAGAMLGWQAIATVSVLSWGISALAMIFWREIRWPWLASRPEWERQVLALAIWTSTLFLHHCFWRTIAHWLRIA
jgi:prepilin signal peptidase PulO-like enzyme (type II secretory pathway)